MNNENLLIEKDVIKQGQDICKFITDPILRNRAVANAIAAKTVLNYFTEVSVDIDSGLHNISQILNFWDISDVYVNGAYVDVRFYFDENELCVPKFHFDNNLLPVAYMFVKVDETLSDAVVTGFIKPEDIDTSVVFDGYYKLNESSLVSYYDISNLFEMVDKDLPSDFETSLHEFFDLDNDSKLEISSYLLVSKEARQKLIDISKASNIFNYISINSVLENVEDKYEESNEEEYIEEFVDELSVQDSSIELLEQESFGSFNESLLDVNPNILTDLTMVENNLNIAPLENLEEDRLENVADDFTTEVTPSISTIDYIDEEIKLADFDEPILSDSTDGDVVSFGEETLIKLDSIDVNLKDDSREEAINALYVDSVNNSSVNDILENEEVNNSSELNVDFVSGNENNISDENIEPQIDLVEGNNTNEASEDIQKSILVQDDNVVNIDENDIDDLNEVINSQDGFLLDLEKELSSEEDDSDEQVAYLESQDAVDSNIDNLFNSDKEFEQQNVENVTSRKKSNKFIPLLGILVLSGVIAYLGISKNLFGKQDFSNINTSSVAKLDSIKNANEKIAMPVENVEYSKTEKKEDIGNIVSVPEIEGNLDASILVENLSVNWEVPVSYVSNITAKRYFTKIGKILQMSLKTELLLLNKPPITNKIVLNLDFNKSTQKFKVKDIIVSSGEDAIDKIIMNAVNSILNNSYNFNMNVFNELQGNPSLIIRL